MTTYDEVYKWVQDGTIITQDEYRMLEEIVHESINRVLEARINGSFQFNEAIGCINVI